MYTAKPSMRASARPAAKLEDGNYAVLQPDGSHVRLTVATVAPGVQMASYQDAGTTHIFASLTRGRLKLRQDYTDGTWRCRPETRPYAIALALIAADDAVAKRAAKAARQPTTVVAVSPTRPAQDARTRWVAQVIRANPGITPEAAAILYDRQASEGNPFE
jgi:hypothetical protein